MGDLVGPELFTDAQVLRSWPSRILLLVGLGWWLARLAQLATLHLRLRWLDRSDGHGTLGLASLVEALVVAIKIL